MLITYELTCAYTACQRAVTIRRSHTQPAPTYCSAACSNQDRRGRHERLRKYVFTDAMNDLIRFAHRRVRGSLKQLWQTDPRFQAAGIPYPIVKRQAVLLGCVQTQPNGCWLPEEDAFVVPRYQQGSPADGLARQMRRHGWHRTPSAIVQRMLTLGVSRRDGPYLSLHQAALALGIDAHVVARWVRREGLPVHHRSDGVGEVQYLAPAALRDWIIAHPYLVSKGQPDLVWLIGLLSTPQAGVTADTPTDGPGDDWMSGEAVRDRGVGD